MDAGPDVRMRAEVFLSAPAYVLGEIEVDHAGLPGFAETARAYRMPASAQLWGWGSVRCTERSIAALAADSGRARGYGDADADR